jgi:hypothetical protein
MTENEKTIKTFCDQFEPPLTYLHTQRVGNVPIPDAWMTSFWSEDKGVGITVIAHSGQIYSYVESNGKADLAEYHGKFLASVFKGLTDAPQ